MELSPKMQATIRRFIKGFVAGGLASIATLLPSIGYNSFAENPLMIVFSLASAFCTGGILAIEKYLQEWKDEEPR